LVLDETEAALEFGIGAAQGYLRIGLHMACEICDREQKIAYFVQTLFIARYFVKNLLDLRDFLANFCKNKLCRIPVEANGACLGLKRDRAGEGGQGIRHGIEKTIRLNVRTTPRRALGLFLRLDGIPHALHLVGAQIARIAEDMRMAADQL